MMGIKIRAPHERRARCRPLETHAINTIANLIDEHGVETMTLTLRIFTETHENNKSAMTADAIFAVHDICRSMRHWTALGMPFLEAWDAIDINVLRDRAKSSALIRIGYKVRSVLCALLIDRLRPQLEATPAPKPERLKREPKLPAWLTRVPGVEKNIALGLELLALRSAIKGNTAFGHAVRHRFDVDGQHACEVMKVARVYGTRPEIFTRLSWNALLHLASPALPAAAREALERRILAGHRIGAPEIRAARAPRKAGRPRRQSERPASRIAA